MGLIMTLGWRRSTLPSWDDTGRHTTVTTLASASIGVPEQVVCNPLDSTVSGLIMRRA